MQNTGGGWGVVDWSPDGRSLLVGEYESVNRSHLWMVDVATGARTPLTPRGADSVAYGGAEFAPDGRTLYVTTDQGAEFQRLARMDLQTRARDAAHGGHPVGRGRRSTCRRTAAPSPS